MRIEYENIQSNESDIRNKAHNDTTRIYDKDVVNSLGVLLCRMGCEKGSR